MSPGTLRCACPGCGERLWRRREGEWTLKARILRLVGDEFVAKCPRCGTDVPVPWLAIGDLATATAGPVLVLRAPPRSPTP